MPIIMPEPDLNMLIAIASFVVTIVFLLGARQGKTWAYEMRHMTQADAISDGVDKALEEGKPAYISPGDIGYLSGMYAVMTIAGMNILRYTSTLCVKKGVRPFLCVPTNPECLPLVDGIYREVCASEGKPEFYRIEDVHFWGGNHSIGLSAAIQRLGASLFVAVGAWTGGGTVTPMGWAYDDGAILVVGTARYGHQGTSAMLGTYPLFAEDIYAFSAYVSGNKEVQCTQVGGDLLKLLCIILISVATVGVAMGVYK